MQTQLAGGEKCPGIDVNLVNIFMLKSTEHDIYSSSMLIRQQLLTFKHLLPRFKLANPASY